MLTKEERVAKREAAEDQVANGERYSLTFTPATVLILLDNLNEQDKEIARLQIRVAELEQRNINLSKIIDGLPTSCHQCGASLGED